MKRRSSTSVKKILHSGHTFSTRDSFPPGVLPTKRQTSHTANSVQAWCRCNFKGFWEKEFWPPSSPDLNPMDFGLWSILETKACRTSHPNLDSLKRKLTSAWDEIDPEVVRATCAQVLPRLRKVIKNKGGYIE